METKNEAKSCVYRYIDKSDGIVKYVGIVNKQKLRARVTAHTSMDDWCKCHLWRIEFFECENQSEAEAFESHLIALYGTGNYYNKAKVSWGINKYLPDIESEWKVFEDSVFADYESFLVANAIRELIRTRVLKKDEIVSLIDYFFEFH